MKRLRFVLLATACCLCLAGGANAQLGGMNFFSKPNIADIFKPVVGQGAVYLSTTEGKPGHEMEMTIVGKEMTPAGEAYWIEMAMVIPGQRPEDVCQDSDDKGFSVHEDDFPDARAGCNGDAHEPE